MILAVAAPIGDPVGDDVPVEDDFLYFSIAKAAILGAPGMSASFSSLGSAMAPPRRARPLGCWHAPCPRFPVVNQDRG